MRQVFYSLVMPVMKLYWHIAKPQSFGVKILITHPNHPNLVLLVLHCYDNTALWNIPGGGYKPKNETAELAAEREVLEELGVSILELKYLGEYQTEAEGKKDSVTLFSGTIENADDIKTSPEISQIAWVEIQSLSNRGGDVARVARRAVEKFLE